MEVIDLGNLQPGEQVQRNISASCVTNKIFPYGASIGQFSAYTEGKAAPFLLVHTGSGKLIPLQAAGTVGPVCLPSTCTRLSMYADVSYYITLALVAGSEFGQYTAMLLLNYTMIGATANSGELQHMRIRYTVGQPSCSLISGSYLNLPFGTLSSHDFSTSQQIADINFNCPSNTRVTATLSSVQRTTGAAGISTTSLPELLMVATWADNNTPVNFDTPRIIGLTSGVSAIRIGFRPKLLSPNSTPAGQFYAQYTLNISYL